MGHFPSFCRPLLDKLQAAEAITGSQITFTALQVQQFHAQTVGGAMKRWASTQRGQTAAAVGSDAAQSPDSRVDLISACGPVFCYNLRWKKMFW